MIILRFGSKSYGFQLANILYDGGRLVGKFYGLVDVDEKSLPWFLWIFSQIFYLSNSRSDISMIM